MKERLDKYLTDLGYFETKSKASSAIMAGNVKINDEYITKSGFQINPEKEYDIVVKSMPFVSRGGFKLKKALETFPVKVQDRICFDAGASTGGFTDCLLQNGAKFVYAVDVGYGQLDWKIRSDNRVKTIEKTNLKICNFENIYADGEPVADLLVSDLSFISLTKVLENLKKLLNPDFHEMILLIKPQFEAGKEKVEKGGVVRDKNVHKEVIENVIDCAKSLGYTINDLTYSSIKGPSGNIEYLIWISTADCLTLGKYAQPTVSLQPSPKLADGYGVLPPHPNPLPLGEGADKASPLMQQASENVNRTNAGELNKFDINTVIDDAFEKLN